MYRSLSKKNEAKMLVNILLKRFVFCVKVKRFNKMFTSILALFFFLRIANKSHFYAPSCIAVAVRYRCSISFSLALGDHLFS